MEAYAYFCNHFFHLWTILSEICQNWLKISVKQGFEGQTSGEIQERRAGSLLLTNPYPPHPLRARSEAKQNLALSIFPKSGYRNMRRFSKKLTAKFRCKVGSKSEVCEGLGEHAGRQLMATNLVSGILAILVF